MRLTNGALAAFAVLGLAFTEHAMADPAAKEQAVTEASFKCIRDMHPVRGFYVDNVQGNLAGTLDVANSPKGGVYPPGSVVQLVPGEVMVKREKGFNAATHDWEFFELDVSAQGTAIRKRGFVEVVNKFGGNCFGCHTAARPEFDLICESDYGCAPIPITKPMIRALQKSDPRCAAVELSAEDKEALAALKAALKPPTAEASSPKP